MDINPPISNRTTEELLGIIETREDWQEDVIESAQQELKKRGISNEVQQLRRKNKTKFQKKIDVIKARASYTILERVLIILFGPLLVIIFSDFFFFHAGEGYKRKNIQGIFYLLLGIAFWIFMLSNL